MKHNLTILFRDAYPPPIDGYVIEYRPKGSLQPYFSFTGMTGNPVKLTANILPGIDYEGVIRSACAIDNSSDQSFVTDQYSNAIGNVIVEGCDEMLYADGISSLKFNGIEMTALDEPLSMTPGESGAFISHEKGTYTLLITHDLSSGRVKVTDSEGTIFKQNIELVQNVFPDAVFNDINPFKIEIDCGIYFEIPSEDPNP